MAFGIVWLLTFAGFFFFDVKGRKTSARFSYAHFGDKNREKYKRELDGWNLWRLGSGKSICKKTPKNMIKGFFDRNRNFYAHEQFFIQKQK